MKSLSIVLLSGGMDSCVTLAVAASRTDVALLHVSYGQRTEARELRAFCEIADYYGVPEERRLITNISYLALIGGSSLTDPHMPVVPPDQETGEIPATYVPFRNAHLLAIAVSWAEVIGARHIFIGAVEEDSPGYPDCRQDFFKAFNRLAKVGTRPTTDVQVYTPLIGLRKAEIVAKGVELAAPFQLTWSCYQSQDMACGRCDSCLRRLRAFRQARVEDPIAYHIRS